MNKIFLCTTFKLCDNNGYLTTQLSNFFMENNFHIVRLPEESDCIVITTCGFDQGREDESISIVDQYIQKYSGEKKIVVCGCLPKINPDLFDLSKVTLIGSKELEKFDELFDAEIKVNTISGGSLDDNFINSEYGFVDSYYIQICQGCTNNCSYCAIKKTKGYVESKTIAEVINEVERGLQLGFRRFMLLGDDCGSYGADINVDLAQLFSELNKYEIRLLVNYIEPGKFLGLYPNIEPSVFDKIDFMNIPVQAASDRIISLMNRRYDSVRVMAVAKEIKENHPHLYIETHVIFGFPGETREEFAETFKLAGTFDAVIYFYYTDRKGVKSALLPGKVPEDEVKHRIDMIVAHPRFTWKQSDAIPPLVLLGYGPETTEIFKTMQAGAAVQGHMVG
ncbi:MAG: radical SAM protein [Desulfuromonadaceae bacterium]|nr:radical SAM protein [Desulfuromonadaceae bacterium]